MILTRIIPGKKFIVRDDFPVKTSGLLLNSTGFIAYPTHMFHLGSDAYLPALGKAIIVLTRKGRKGKDRIEIMSLTTPLLYDENLAKKHSKEYKKMYSVYPVLNTYSFKKNILELSAVDFIAWAVAYRLYIKKLFEYSNLKFKKIPKKSNDLFNIITEISSLFNYEQEKATEAVACSMFRTNIIERYRGLETIISYDIKQRLSAAVNVSCKSMSLLIHSYKKIDAPDRFIKEAEALKTLIKRDGQKAVTTHIE